MTAPLCALLEGLERRGLDEYIMVDAGTAAKQVKATPTTPASAMQE
jgi:hypothetical protein